MDLSGNLWRINVSTARRESRAEKDALPNNLLDSAPDALADSDPATVEEPPAKGEVHLLDALRDGVVLAVERVQRALEVIFRLLQARC